MALLRKELEVVANKRRGMHLFSRKLVSSSIKKRIVEMILIGLLIGFLWVIAKWGNCLIQKETVCVCPNYTDCINSVST